MKLGIELNNAFLLLLILSKAPDLTSPSSWSLLISLGLILSIKSLIDLKLPLLILSLTIDSVVEKYRKVVLTLFFLWTIDDVRFSVNVEKYLHRPVNLAEVSYQNFYL